MNDVYVWDHSVSAFSPPSAIGNRRQLKSKSIIRDLGGL
jgi:hypothetical protein